MYPYAQIHRLFSKLSIIVSTDDIPLPFIFRGGACQESEILAIQ